MDELRVVDRVRLLPHEERPMLEGDSALVGLVIFGHRAPV
jgi:hypothetical protein